MATNSSSEHRLYGIIFTVIAAIALVALVFVISARSEADDTSQTATVTNAPPSIDALVTAISSGGGDQSAINLTENTTTDVYSIATISDDNGCGDVDTAANHTIVFHQSDAGGGASCSANTENCYPVGEGGVTISGCTGGSDTQLTGEATDALEHYATPTDGGPTNWVNSYTVQDDSAVADTVTDAFEVNTLIALNVPASLNYGSLTLGATSAEQTLTITNTGNDAIDVNVSVDGDMTCTDGSIPAGSLEYSTSSGFTYGSTGTDITTDATAVHVSIFKRINGGGPETGNIYFKLQAPASGASGTCTNTLTVAATTNS